MILTTIISASVTFVTGYRIGRRREARKMRQLTADLEAHRRKLAEAIAANQPISR